MELSPEEPGVSCLRIELSLSVAIARFLEDADMLVAGVDERKLGKARGFEYGTELRDPVEIPRFAPGPRK